MSGSSLEGLQYINIKVVHYKELLLLPEQQQFFPLITQPQFTKSVTCNVFQLFAFWHCYKINKLNCLVLCQS